MTPPRPAVLIVEDERIVAKDLQQTIAALGYDAYAIASSCDEALERATERRPDVVLMDIRIKGEPDGIGTAEVLRERLGVPIVYMTAHADHATLERAKRTEPHGYVLKPVKAAELRSAIEVSIYKFDAERRLRERERWFSTTLRSIGDAVIAVDRAGEVAFMNPVAEQLTGVPADRALGHAARDVLRLVSDDGRPMATTPLDRALAEVRPGSLGDTALVDATTGQARTICDSAAPVVDGGHLLGAVMVFRDVEEERRLQRRLERADRLASLGTMAAGVAHEINNPLAVVVAGASLLEGRLAALGGGAVIEPTAWAEMREVLGDLQTAASRIARIVGDLRELSRPPASTPGDADVARAVDWATRATAHELRSRCRLAVAVAPGLRVACDEARLGQVLINLVLNAAHAIAPGDIAGNEIAISAGVEGGRAAIAVRDTGPGMPREVLDHVFEPFFTTKPVGEGTGLGLAISRGIVRAAGGELAVDSAIGAGTMVTVWLPVAADPPSAPAPIVRAPAVAHVRGRILVADDDPLVLRAVERILADHEVVPVLTGAEALARIDAGDRFDAIVCDLQMPAMTGMALHAALVARDPALADRVVFMTGGAVTAGAREFLGRVPNQWLDKPFEPDAIRAVISELVARSHPAEP